MRELPQPTAGETARSLQEVTRLFADEIDNLTAPFNDDHFRFVKDTRALVPCLEELVGFLADEGASPVRNHSQWLYEIDTAVMLLDQIADARAREHYHVVHALIFSVETMLSDVASYAQIALGAPLTLPPNRYDDHSGDTRKSMTVH